MRLLLFTFLFVFIFSDVARGGVVPPVANAPLRICAFNVQVFGTTKMGKVDVVESLIEILLRYDLILIQEIRDSTDTAFNELVTILNTKIRDANGDLGDEFSSVISDKLGRSSSKEQYGFLYRRNLLQVEATYQYPDSEDYFERPPFNVLFHSPTTDIEYFGIMALHSKPSMAPEEVDNITRVYERVKKHWDLQDILVAGDLNSDCDYLPDRDHAKIGLYHDDRFQWLIGDDVDTTTKGSECSYDRFIAAGIDLRAAVVPNSPKVYRYDLDLQLTPEETADVSDHYPIEMELAGKPNMQLQNQVKDSKAIDVESKNKVETKNTIRYMKSNIPTSLDNSRAYKVTTLLEGTKQYLITAVLDNIPTFVQTKYELAHLQDQLPKLFTAEMESLVLAMMDSASFQTDYVYGLRKIMVPSYKIELKCVLETLICKMTVEKHLL